MLDRPPLPRIFPLIFSLLIVGLSFFWGVTQLEATAIYCYVDYSSCSPAVTNSLKLLVGQRLIGVDTEEHVQTALQPHAQVRLMRLQKNINGELSIFLEPQEVSFVFLPGKNQTPIPITDQGRLITGDIDSNWPIFLVTPEFNSELQQAGKIEPQLQSQLLVALKTLNALSLPYSSILIVDPRTLHIEFVGQPAALVPLTHAETELYRVREILKAMPTLTIPEPITEVDVRYKLPVLRATATMPRHESL